MVIFSRSLIRSIAASIIALTATLILRVTGAGGSTGSRGDCSIGLSCFGIESAPLSPEAPTLQAWRGRVAAPLCAESMSIYHEFCCHEIASSCVTPDRGKARTGRHTRRWTQLGGTDG